MMRRFGASSLAAGLVLTTIALPAAAQTPQETFPAACPGGAPVAGFQDVPRDNVHAAAIDCGVASGIIEGTSTSPLLYSPQRELTRGQIASLIARTLDQIDAGLPSASGAPSFPDAGAPHGDNVRRLAAAGIVFGLNDGTYGTQQPVTRDQLASLFVRATQFALGDPIVPLEQGHFPDVDNVHAVNVDAAFELGLMLGKTDGRFAPRDATRRDQAGSVSVRFLDGLTAVVEAPFQLTILHTNDGESALIPGDTDPGAARFVADLQIAQLEALLPEDVEVDASTRAALDSHDEIVRRQVTVFAGDAFLPGPQLNASTEGDEFYDALVYTVGQYDAMTVGNHEFDQGPDLLADFIEATGDIPFISANLDVSGEPRLVAAEAEGRLAASTTVRRGGRDIAIVGATTEDLPTLTSPGEVIATDVLEAVQAEADAARAAGADLVILSSHLQNINNELALVEELSGVDAVVGGGGGEDLRDTYPLVAEDADGVSVPVVTVPGNYRDVGKLVLEVGGDGEIGVGDGSELALVELEGPVNELIRERVEEPVEAFVAELAETVVATTEVELDGRRNAVRTRETNLGDLLSDGLLAAAQARADQFGVPVADVALQNGGGIRNEDIVPTGDLTVLDTFTTAPFGNFVAVTTVDVENFVELLEHGISGLPEVEGRFGQWAGVEFRYDVSQPVGSRIVEATITSGDEDVAVVVAGEVQDGVDDVTVAGLNFTLNGGDGYPFETPFTTLGLTDQQAFSDILRSLGTVTADDYPDLTIDADLYRRYGPIDGDFIDD